MAFDYVMKKDTERKELGQYFTPTWVAEQLVARHFPELDETSFVIEPSCGSGAFLHAIPENVPAVGVEIDPKWARAARAATGRKIIRGDFSKIKFARQPTHIIGNPPFEMKIVEAFLARAQDLLPEGGKVGFILPSYMFQTPSRVVKWNDDWSLYQEMLPRTIFGGAPGDQLIKKPLAFVIFTKDREKRMDGFALYREMHDVSTMPEQYQDLLREAAGSAWFETVLRAMIELQGEADLKDIYKAVAPQRPSGSPWWQENVRRVLQKDVFIRVGEARYKIVA